MSDINQFSLDDEADNLFDDTPFKETSQVAEEPVESGDFFSELESALSSVETTVKRHYTIPQGNPPAGKSKQVQAPMTRLVDAWLDHAPVHVVGDLILNLSDPRVRGLIVLAESIKAEYTIVGQLFCIRKQRPSKQDIYRIYQDFFMLDKAGEGSYHGSNYDPVGDVWDWQFHVYLIYKVPDKTGWKPMRQDQMGFADIEPDPQYNVGE